MRILHVTASLDPRSGGVAEAVRQIGGALVRAGHQTEVATTDGPGEGWTQDLPFPVHTLGPGRGGVYQYAPALGKWLRSRRDDFDCVVSHGLWQYHGLATCARGKGPPPALCFRPRNARSLVQADLPSQAPQEMAVLALAEYRLLRTARAVFFTCDEERWLARESFWLYRANEAVNPLGIREPPGDPEGQKVAFLEKFPELRGKRLVLFLGRLVVKKGCDLLLRAFAKLNERPGDAVLVMPDRTMRSTLPSRKPCVTPPLDIVASAGRVCSRATSNGEHCAPPRCSSCRRTRETLAWRWSKRWRAVRRSSCPTRSTSGARSRRMALALRPMIPSRVPVNCSRAGSRLPRPSAPRWPRKRWLRFKAVTRSTGRQPNLSNVASLWCHGFSLNPPCPCLLHSLLTGRIAPTVRRGPWARKSACKSGLSPGRYCADGLPSR